jgi:hypothetical protein
VVASLETGIDPVKLLEDNVVFAKAVAGILLAGNFKLFKLGITV